MTDAARPGEVPAFDTIAAFFAQALAIEVEAAERYALLADQMEVHNNAEIAAIFHKMAAVEAEHHSEIARRADEARVAGAPANFRWTSPDGPEAAAFEDAHYLMTPRQALLLARFNEERAVLYFEAIAGAATDPEVAALAAEMARDERSHVMWVDQWLEKFAPDVADWDDDADPQVNSE